MLVLDNVSNLILEVGRQNVTDRAVSSIKTRGSKVVTHLATAINDKSNRKQSLNLAGREFNRTGKAIGQYLKQKARGVSNLGHEVFLTPLDKNYSSRVKAAVVNPNERIDDMKTIRLTKKHIKNLHNRFMDSQYFHDETHKALDKKLKFKIDDINTKRQILLTAADMASKRLNELPNTISDKESRFENVQKTRDETIKISNQLITDAKKSRRDINKAEFNALKDNIMATHQKKMVKAGELLNKLKGKYDN